MTPAELDNYTAETREKLKDASWCRVGEKIDLLQPYEAGPPLAPTTAPFTFASAFMWSPEANAQKPAWMALVAGMRMALGKIYPDCPHAWSEFTIDSAKHIALVLAQFYAKTRRTARGNLVYIEADVVCNKRCNPFEADFDIGICDSKEKWPMMPFNPGVMFAKDTPGAQKFLDTAMEYASHIPLGFSAWYAYQVGLSHAYLVLKDKVNIKVFPHAEYNWSPDVYAPTDAYFIHLKGPRKGMQGEYLAAIAEGKRGNLILP